MAYGLAISERRNAARAGTDDDCRRNTRSGGLLDNPTETRRIPHRRLAVEPPGHTNPVSNFDGKRAATKRTQWPNLTPRAGLRNEPNVKL